LPEKKQELVGSQYYVKNLAPEKLNKIRAMVGIDTLGLGATEVWVSRSDKELVADIATLAHALNLPVTRVDVDGGAHRNSY
jgi:Zn-dependent M28 family amino/carboxypeptidase